MLPCRRGISLLVGRSGPQRHPTMKNPKYMKTVRTVLDIQVMPHQANVPPGFVLAQITFTDKTTTIRNVRIDASDTYRWFTTDGEELVIDGGLL